VEDYQDSSSDNSRINLSRNRPIAFVVGVGGFLGSHLTEKLLSKGIQVIGVDDFSIGKRENLIEASKDKNFHLLNTSINEPLFASTNSLVSLSISRLDYAFFVADADDSQELLSTGLLNFLYFVEKHSPSTDKKSKNLKKHLDKTLAHSTKVVFGSSILLYNDELASNHKRVKEAEILFAKFCKENKLNARVIRMATLYGPRMHFREQDPLIKLIYAAATDKLDQTLNGTQFVTQAVYVEDAAELLVKSVVLGSTANKIYDCLRPHPVYIAELKQLLTDPLWFEERGFKPTLLPEWFSPNLSRTIRELSWQPKTSFLEGLSHTIKYFKAYPPESSINPNTQSDNPLFGGLSKWTFNNPLFHDENEEKSENEIYEGDSLSEKQQLDEAEKYSRSRMFKKRVQVFLVLGLIIVGLVLPLFQLIYGGFMVRANIAASSEAITKGEFEKAFSHIAQAQEGVKEARGFFSALALAERIGIFPKQIQTMQTILSVVDEGVEGIDHATEGTKALFQTTKTLSGEDSTDPREYYEKAQIELTEAQKKLQVVETALESPIFMHGLPSIVTSRVGDMKIKVAEYSELVEKARAAAYLLPSITAIDGKKSYLMLLQNNLELRPGGGFIGSYAKITFEKGRLADIKVDDIYNLDGGLQDIIEPPAELKNDLGQNRWYLRDSNLEPDFPTSARQAEAFYRRTTGEVVNGVVAINLAASAKLVDAVGGVDLPEYGESVNGANLFEKTVNKSEVGFFPGSQAKRNYLTALQTQLFNKIFYLSKQNWPAIIRAVGDSLEEKQMMVYLSDPTLFSYAVSENWGGVLPRGVVQTEGRTEDFLAIIESNMGANKANYYLDRTVRLETLIGKEGEISEKLTVNYKNGSPGDVFPGGRYKNRFKIYLPMGSKLNKMSYGESDITSQVASFTDYGRTGYSVLLELAAQEQKSLVVDYTLVTPLTFKDGKALYRLDLIKQSGIIADPFEWKMTYPLNYYVVDSSGNGTRGEQTVNYSSDLSRDRAFELTFEQR
jgi:nucleoside-diphosphate-sugar epimerase